LSERIPTAQKILVEDNRKSKLMRKMQKLPHFG
jgi:hypothetical protein